MRIGLIDTFENRTTSVSNEIDCIYECISINEYISINKCIRINEYKRVHTSAKVSANSTVCAYGKRPLKYAN